MSNELITLENLSAPEVFKQDKVTEILNYVEARIKEFVPDETTKEGLDAIDEFAWKITKSKTLLVNMGDDYAKFLKEEPKKVDRERKRIKDTLEMWAKQVRKPVTDREDAEKCRIAAQELALSDINNYLTFITFPSAVNIQQRIDELKDFCSSRDWQEYHAKAAQEYTRVWNILVEMFVKQTERDKDHAELERLRKEEEERNREKREKEIAAAATKAAEDRAAAEANRVAEETARAIKAEEDRVAEISRRAAEDAERAKKLLSEQAEQAERNKAAALKAQADALADQAKKLNDEKAAKDAADAKRQADQEHISRINHAIILGIVDIDRPELTTELAKVILEAIAGGKIPHVSIQY